MKKTQLWGTVTIYATNWKKIEITASSVTIDANYPLMEKSVLRKFELLKIE